MGWPCGPQKEVEDGLPYCKRVSHGVGLWASRSASSATRAALASKTPLIVPTDQAATADEVFKKLFWRERTSPQISDERLDLLARARAFAVIAREL